LQNSIQIYKAALTAEKVRLQTCSLFPIHNSVSHKPMVMKYLVSDRKPHALL
jgi:hypothetical protein